MILNGQISPKHQSNATDKTVRTIFDYVQFLNETAIRSCDVDYKYTDGNDVRRSITTYHCILPQGEY